jgi:hypothetical protein
VFRGFSRSLQANATTAFFQVLSNSPFVNHPTIISYIVDVLTASLNKPQKRPVSHAPRVGNPHGRVLLCFSAKGGPQLFDHTFHFEHKNRVISAPGEGGLDCNFLKLVQ